MPETEKGNHNTNQSEREPELSIQLEGKPDLKLDENCLASDNPSAMLHNLQRLAREAELKHDKKIEKLFHEIFGPKETYEGDMATYVARIDAFKEGYKWGNIHTYQNIKKELSEKNLQIVKMVKSEPR